MKNIKEVLKRHSAWKDALMIPSFLVIGLVAFIPIDMTGHESILMNLWSIVLFVLFKVIGLFSLYSAISRIIGWIVVGRVPCNINYSSLKPGQAVEAECQLSKYSPEKLKEASMELVHIFNQGRTYGEETIVSTESPVISGNTISFKFTVPESLPFTGRKLLQEYNARLNFKLWVFNIARDYKVYIE